MIRLLAAVFVLVALHSASDAHELRPGFLEIRETGAEAYNIRFKVPARGDMRLGLRVRLPPACAETAPTRSERAGTAILEHLAVRCRGGLVGREVSIDGLSGTFTDVVVRVESDDGAVQAARLTPDNPSFIVEAAPTWIETARTYFLLGLEHILLGVDHLLFVLALLLLVRDLWMLVKVITAFTVAHSITLAVATLGYARVPIPPLNAAVALSILFLGPEIARSWRGETSLTIRFPWCVAFLFGLLHGFGFASGLSTTGMPKAELPPALLFFNVGVELGQLAFVFTALALVRSLYILEVRWPRWAELAPGYAVGSLGAYWTIQRVTIMLAA